MNEFVYLVGVRVDSVKDIAERERRAVEVSSALEVGALDENTGENLLALVPFAFQSGLNGVIAENFANARLNDGYIPPELIRPVIDEDEMMVLIIGKDDRVPPPFGVPMYDDLDTIIDAAQQEYGDLLDDDFDYAGRLVLLTGVR